jgi:hypothetical protein
VKRAWRRDPFAGSHRQRGSRRPETVRGYYNFDPSHAGEGLEPAAPCTGRSDDATGQGDSLAHIPRDFLVFLLDFSGTK